MSTIDYGQDIFRARLQRQMLKGIHRHWLAKRANAEYLEIGLLVMTEPMESDPNWWQIRADVLGLDADPVRPAKIETRVN